MKRKEHESLGPLECDRHFLKHCGVTCVSAPECEGGSLRGYPFKPCFLLRGNHDHAVSMDECTYVRLRWTFRIRCTCRLCFVMNFVHHDADFCFVMSFVRDLQSAAGLYDQV